jgi:hypothetical protein
MAISSNERQFFVAMGERNCQQFVSDMLRNVLGEGAR